MDPIILANYGLRWLNKFFWGGSIITEPKKGLFSSFIYKLQAVKIHKKSSVNLTQNEKVEMNTYPLDRLFDKIIDF